jgi:hypothetical protein
MSSEDLKKKAEEFAAKVGKPKARKALVLEGVSPHTADKIISGRYPSEIGELLGAAIERAIKAA